MSQGKLRLQDLHSEAIEELTDLVAEKIKAKSSVLTNQKVFVYLRNQQEYRKVDGEAASILDIDSGMFLFRFERDQEEIWIPMTEITSLKVIQPLSPPLNLTATVVN